MTIHYDEAIPSLAVDDGTMLIFNAQLGNLYARFGILHLPVSASQTDSSNPPVTWTLSSDPATWVETLKYASRAQVAIKICWDDAGGSWYTSPTDPGNPMVLNTLLGVTG